MTANELVEWVVRWASEPPRDARLSRARAQFERRTGPIEVDQPDYEARIGHFLDCFVCRYQADGSEAPVAAFAAAHPALGQRERVILAGLLRSQRSLFRVERETPSPLLHDLLSGAVFELRDLNDERLSVGEIFDGNVYAQGDSVNVSPGKVFHPAHTHACLVRLVEDESARDLDRERLLDALLAMLDRLQRFTRVKPEHLYTIDAIGSEAFSATWTRSSRPPPPKAHGAP